MQVRPLTRRGKDGRVLTRSPEVEAQIAEALGLDPPALRRRVAVVDRECSQYLKEETLVYLLREHHRQGDGDSCNMLADALLRRCAPQANKYLRALAEQEFESAYADLVGQVSEIILDLGSDRGDFLQVRFGLKLKQLAIDAFRRYSGRINEDTRTLVSWSSVSGYEGPDDDEGSRRALLPDQLRTPTAQEDRRLQGNEALRHIPEPQRTAYVLFHFDGWPIESKDVHNPSISRFFSRDPRTIRNWLKMAEQALERWRGEQP